MREFDRFRAQEILLIGMGFERFLDRYPLHQRVITMKIIPAILVALTVAAQCVSAQILQGRLVTSAFAFQQQDSGSSASHLYGYQSVQLSFIKGDYTLSTYFQGWNDFSGPTKNNGTLRLYNLYFHWRNIANYGDLTFGRQTIFAGTGIGTIDGLKAVGRFLDNKVKVVGYAGPLAQPSLGAQPVDNIWDNAMYGGQVVVAPVEFGQASVSYMHKQLQPEAYSAIRRDSLFNPYLAEIRPSASIEEYLSADVSGEYDMVYGYLRYDHDLQAEKMARFQFFTRVKPLERFGITAEYMKREPRISYNSIFSAFTYNSLEEFEVGLEYHVHHFRDLHVFGKYGQVSFGDETSQQYIFGGSWKYISASASSISGYNGTINAASFNAGYPFMNNTLTPTLMVSYGRYKLSRYETKRESVLSGALGVVYRPLPVLSFDTQVQWIQNKIYKNDVRMFFRASYLLNERLTLF